MLAADVRLDAVARDGLVRAGPAGAGRSDCRQSRQACRSTVSIEHEWLRRRSSRRLRKACSATRAGRQSRNCDTTVTRSRDAQADRGAFPQRSRRARDTCSIRTCRSACRSVRRRSPRRSRCPWTTRPFTITRADPGAIGRRHLQRREALGDSRRAGVCGDDDARDRGRVDRSRRAGSRGTGKDVRVTVTNHAKGAAKADVDAASCRKAGARRRPRSRSASRAKTNR